MRIWLFMTKIRLIFIYQFEFFKIRMEFHIMHVSKILDNVKIGYTGLYLVQLKESQSLEVGTLPTNVQISRKTSVAKQYID